MTGIRHLRSSLPPIQDALQQNLHLQLLYLRQLLRQYDSLG
ncbi:hypothetical protein EVA_15600 [gut metagenome]|uniref:Uncharacterized protein n=1 Tax=gut metagenome TaxID=749906 RepID=J9FPA4_9ZZZZ